MSLVKKFAKGGTAEVSTFDVGGRKVNKDDFIYLAKKNWATFKSNYGISGDDEISSDDAFNKVLTSIENGNITSMGINGELYDKTGELSNGDRDGDPYGKAARYLYELSVGVDTYKEKEAKDASILKYADTKGDLLNIVNNDFYGGNYTGSDSDIKLWSNLDTVDENGVRSRVNRMNKTADFLEKLKADISTREIDYTGSKYKDKNDRIARIDNAIALLRKGEYNDDIVRALMDVGEMTSAQATSWLADGTEAPKTEETPTDSTTKTKEEEIKKAAEEYMKAKPGVSLEDAMALATAKYDQVVNQNIRETKQELENAKFGDWIAQATESFKPFNFDLTQTDNDGKTYLYNNYATQKNLGISDNIWKLYSKVMSGKGKSFIDIWNTNSSVIKRNLRALLEFDAKTALEHGETENLKHLGNNLFLLKGYTRYNKGYAWIYDGNKNEFRKVKSTDNIQSIYDANKEWWSNNIAKQKEGGKLVLKAANGMTLMQAIQKHNANLRETRQQNIKAKAKTQNRTEKAIENGSKKVDGVGDAMLNLDTGNSLRVAAAIGDFGGAIASFVPGGSVVSLIQGVGSDLARAGADYADGASAGDIAWNFAKNIGMTAITSIPIIGTSGKIGKAWKGVKALIPWAIAITSGVSDVEAARKAYNNIESGNGTVDDYMAMFKLLTTAANVGKLSSSTIKARAIKKAADTGNSEITVKGRNGDIKLNSQQLEQLKTSTSRSEMNTKLREMGINNEIDFGHLNKFNPFSQSLRADGKHFWNQSAAMTEKPILDFGLVKGKYSADAALMYGPGKVRDAIGLPSWFKLPSFGYNASKTTATKPTAPTTTLTSNPIGIQASVEANEAAMGLKHGGRLETVISKHKEGGIIKAQTGTWDWAKMQEKEQLPVGWNEYTVPAIQDTYQPTLYHTENSEKILNPYVALYPKEVKDKNTAYGGMLNTTETHTKTTGDDVVNVMRNYLKDIGRLRKDIQSYADRSNYEDVNKFLEDYNKDIVTVNNSWNRKEPYAYPQTGWRNHNQAHQRLYQSLNDPFAGELKYETELVNSEGKVIDLEDILGSTTAHRVADNYNKKYADLNDAEKENRTHTVNIKGKEYQVYKEADGTLHLLENKVEEKPVEEKQTDPGNPGNPAVTPSNHQGIPYDLYKQNIQPTNINPNQVAADVLGGITAYDTIRTNDLMAENAKKYRVPFKNPNSKVAPTADIYNIEADAQANAGIVDLQGRQIQNSTSSLEQGILARLQSARNAAKLRQEASLKADEKRQTYADKSVEVANYNHEQEVETGNWNSAMGVQKFNHDIEVENGRQNANLQVRTALRDKYEQRLAQKAAEEKARARAKKEEIENAQQEWHQKRTMLIAEHNMKTDPNYVKYNRIYENAVKANDTATASLAQKQLETLAQKYQLEAHNAIGKYVASRYGVNWSDLKNIPVSYNYLTLEQESKYLGKGGTLEDNIFKAKLDDNRRFDKRISEMIKYNQKAVGDSTAITRAMINKLMAKF